VIMTPIATRPRAMTVRRAMREVTTLLDMAP
jgi:hypothetical protein